MPKHLACSDGSTREPHEANLGHQPCWEGKPGPGSLQLPGEGAENVRKAARSSFFRAPKPTRFWPALLSTLPTIHLSWLVSMKAITALADPHPYTKGKGGRRIFLLSFKMYVEMAGPESS